MKEEIIKDLAVKVIKGLSGDKKATKIAMSKKINIITSKVCLSYMINCTTKEEKVEYFKLLKDKDLSLRKTVQDYIKKHMSELITAANK